MSTPQAADALDTVNHWLQQLSPPSGQPLALDAQRQCAVADLDGQACLVHVPAGSSDLVFYADLMRLNQPFGARFYEQVLALNMMGESTRGGVLSFDADAATLVFFHRQPVAGLDAASFAHAVHGFIGAADGVRRRLQELAAASVASAAPAAAQPTVAFA